MNQKEEKAFKQRIADMELLKKFREKSTMTKEDALQLGNEVKKNMALKLALKK